MSTLKIEIQLYFRFQTESTRKNEVVNKRH
jgi:hypothetical protein